MPLSLNTLVPILLDKTASQVETIKEGAEKVVFGLSTSISALNQSATFDREDAAIVLEACRKVRAIRKANPAADASSVPAGALAHQLRRSSQFIWGP